MRQTLAEIGQQLATDKTRSAGYIENYERYLGHLRDEPVRLLELGVFQGGSLLMWQRYFPQGVIVGLDLQPNPLSEMPERVHFYQGSQDDTALLERIARECAPQGFDIVIDDAAHIGTLARTSFRYLFEKHIKPGGLYVIEDWGTGYWESWPDGSAYRSAQRQPIAQPNAAQSFRDRLAKWLGSALPAPPNPAVDPNFAMHNFGMVGLVKELVDEVAWGDITHPQLGSDLPQRAFKIPEITVKHGQVFVVKA